MLELDGTNLTYEKFRSHCLKPNRPAIIRNACRGPDATYFHVTELIRRLSPQALIEAIGPETQVPVYLNHFSASFKDTETSNDTVGLQNVEEHTAPVLACSTGRAASAAAAREKTQTSQQVICNGEEDDEEGCRELPLKAVLKSWVRNRARGAAESRVLYLKDWHLQEALECAAAAAANGQSEGMDFAKQRERGVHGNALYRVPGFLGPDWIDPFCRYVLTSTRPVAEPEGKGCSTDTEKMLHEKNKRELNTTDLMGFGNNKSDYRFAYIGPVGSWTPLHCDVFGTYSWSFNVCGDKLWFFPTVSGNAYLHAHLPPFFPTPPDIRVLTGFEMEGVVQHPGDLVFVPARFFHQVHNITGEVFPFSYGGPDERVGNAPALAKMVAKKGVDRDEAALLPKLGVVGPLTMALNHNWCNVFNIECMTRAFLNDAERLVSQLSVDDLEIICDTKDAEAWRRHVDIMLHSGANWSYVSMTCFLEFCASRVESSESEMVASADEREMAAARLQQLLCEVRESRKNLFGD